MKKKKLVINGQETPNIIYFDKDSNEKRIVVESWYRKYPVVIIKGDTAVVKYGNEYHHVTFEELYNQLRE